jgi:site-specific recombinase XerD
MRTRSGFRSQLSFVPQSPNGPAGLSLAGPYYFQPECALFETNKAAEGQKEAAGENDAALVSPGARLTISNAGFARMLERAGTVLKLSFNPHPHMVRHACGFALANRGHDTRALQAYLGHRNVSIRALYELSPTRFKNFWRE